jgi:hypothetical protein
VGDTADAQASSTLGETVVVSTSGVPPLEQVWVGRAASAAAVCPEGRRLRAFALLLAFAVSLRAQCY